MFFQSSYMQTHQIKDIQAGNFYPFQMNVSSYLAFSSLFIKAASTSVWTEIDITSAHNANGQMKKYHIQKQKYHGPGGIVYQYNNNNVKVICI